MVQVQSVDPKASIQMPDVDALYRDHARPLQFWLAARVGRCNVDDASQAVWSRVVGLARTNIRLCARIWPLGAREPRPSDRTLTSKLGTCHVPVAHASVLARRRRAAVRCKLAEVAPKTRRATTMHRRWQPSCRGLDTEPTVQTRRDQTVRAATFHSFTVDTCVPTRAADAGRVRNRYLNDL